MSCVADEAIKDDQNISIELLIGANCARALETIKVIPSEIIVLMKTVLGWCIIEPISYRNQSEGKISCSWTTVMEADSNKVSRHYFAVENKLTPDVDVKSMLKKIYEQEFTEPNMRFASVIGETTGDVSYDDQIFLRLMDQETVQVDNHYEILLPLESTDATFPNKNSAAMKRLNSLNRRFIRDKSFHEMYKTFTDDMLQKGYARKAENELVGKVWYIPHHGVTHPAKPGKVRVVFDCSTEFGGASLNKQLIAGPDLTNQLVGVLTRFREEHIAYMADIEAMFHQVRVPENQRSLLRFLWWEQGDPRMEVEEFEMCVHLFGGKSSPSCSNYALRRTSVDYEIEFGEDAAKTLQRNFYVDDMLKSSPDVETAIDLISRVRGLCAAGGFNLTKFVSNHVEVMQAIPDEHVRKNVNLKEFEKPKSQSENTFENTF